MKIKNLLSAMALVAFSTGSMFAADFYVASNGDDSNPGTQERPFGSPEAAFLAVANEGSNPCNVYLEKDATFKVGTIRIEDNCVVNVMATTLHSKPTTFQVATEVRACVSCA